MSLVLAFVLWFGIFVRAEAEKISFKLIEMQSGGESSNDNMYDRRTETIRKTALENRSNCEPMRIYLASNKAFHFYVTKSNHFHIIKSGDRIINKQRVQYKIGDHLLEPNGFLKLIRIYSSLEECQKNIEQKGDT